MSLEDIKNYINDIRRNFADKSFDQSIANKDPFAQFSTWFEEAVDAQILDPFAVVVSSVSEIGYPSTRVVYMRDITDEGFIFYTNYNSQKGKELMNNPGVSLLFFWGELDRQIRISGMAEKVPAKVSDAYFASRPRESQIGAWSSEQSTEIDSRSVLEEQFQYYTEKFKDLPVPRPEHWGGFLVRPNRFEFWQGRPNRLHDRVVYLKNEDSTDWNICRVSP